VLLAGAGAFTALFFWLHDLRWRADDLQERRRSNP